MRQNGTGTAAYSVLYRVDRSTTVYTTNPVTGNSFGTTGTLNVSGTNLVVNALAYNAQDGYLYAVSYPVDNGTATAIPHLYKIGLGGVQDVGATTLPKASFAAGTFDKKGNYYVVAREAASINTLYRLTVASSTPLTATSVPLQKADGTAAGVTIYDLAYNPSDNNLYGVYAANVLYKLVLDNATTPTKAVVTTTGTASGETMGTNFFDISGRLYAYSNGTVGTAGSGKFYIVDTQTGAFTQLSTIDPVSNSDGASCINPLQRLDVVKTLTSLTAVNATTYDVAYTLQLRNTGTVTDDNVQVSELLRGNANNTTFPTATSVAISGLTVTNLDGSTLAANPSFTGVSGSAGLLSGSQGLTAGQRATLSFTVRVVFPAGAVPAATQNNTAYATSTSTGPNVGYMQTTAGVLLPPNNLVANDASTNSATMPGLRASTDDTGDTPSPTPVIFPASIQGTVFEDVNYGGGAGRDLSASSGVGRSGATVELYTGVGTTATFASSATTDANGAYTFPNLTAGASYTVRVVNSTVTSSRTGALASLLPVQTYVYANANRVGGEAPEKADAAAGAAGTQLGSLTTATATAESIVPLTLSSTTASPTASVNVGFNYDLVVNNNDAGQGSLRQFITNSNALGGETSLAQVYTAASGTTTALATALETSIFMISNGTAVAGQAAGLTSKFATTTGSSSATTITLASALPAITGPYTAIDGSTQTRTTGDTNAAVTKAGTESTGPEVLINLNSFSGIAIAASNDQLVGLGIANSLSAEQGVVVRNNATGTVIRNSTINNNGANISFTASTAASAATITGNVIRTALRSGAGGIELNGGNNNLTISNNQLLSNAGFGLDFVAGANTGNTITGNVFASNGTATGTDQLSGIGLRGAGSNNNTISLNTFSANNGAGIVAKSGTTGNIFSQNSFLGNGGASKTGLGLGIDLMGGGTTTNNGDGVTLNDTGDPDTGANGLINFPIIQKAVLNNGVLTVTGFARPGVKVELYLAAADPTNFGEGQTYLTSFTQGTAAGTSGAVTTGAASTYGSAAINGVSQGTDNTNTFAYTYTPTTAQLALLAASGALLTSTATLAAADANANFGTSEFSGNARVMAPPVPNDVTNASVPSNTLTPVGLSPNVLATANGFTSDVTTSTANSIASYTVSQPSSGTLYYNGTALTGATVVPAANIGQLSYLPVFGFVGNATFGYTALDANGAASTAHNTGTATADGAATYTIPVAAAADVTTALTGPATLSPGLPSGTYTATFTNEGPQPAASVTRKVTLPAGATNVLVNGAAYAPTNNVIDFGTATTLASGAANAFTFSFTPASTATGSLAIVSNVATTTSEGTNAAPNASTISAAATAAADVAVTIAAGSPAVAAGTLASASGAPKFTVSFANNGPAAAAGVAATVQLPTGLTNVTATSGGSYSATTGLVTYPSLTALAASATTTSVITFDAPKGGPVVALATVATTTTEAGQTANNAASASLGITPAFDLTTALSGPTSATVGNLVTLAVTTTNNGPSAAASAGQTVQLPTGLSNVYVSNGGSYSTSTGVVTFPTIGSLPSGQTVANSVSFSAPATAFAPLALVTPNTTAAGETNPANNTAYLNGTTSTSLAIGTATTAQANAYTKISASVASASVGGSVTLTVVTGNNGPSATASVVQTVQLLPGFTTATMQVGGQTGTLSGNVITFGPNGPTYNTLTGIVTFATISSQASGANVSNTITFAAPASVGNNGQLLALAAVSTPTPDPMPADNVASVAVTLLSTADLATTIAGPTATTAGQVVQYAATFVNNGPMAASGYAVSGTQTSGVIETAQLPAGLSSVAMADATGAAVSGASYSAATGLVTFPALTADAVGATQVYLLSFVAPAQSFVVRSSVTTASPDGTAANNSASVATTVAAAADLVTTVAGPATAVVGNAVTYGVTTTNNGPSPATNAVTTLQLATGLTTVSVPNGTYNSTTGLVTFTTTSSLASGASVANSITFVMPNPTSGQTAGVASATAATTDPNPGNNAASVATSIAPTTTVTADVAATVAASATAVAAGGALTFTAGFSNSGAAAAQNVTPALQLPAGLTVGTISNSGAYNATTGLVSWPTIASQASGTSGTVSYTVSLTAPATGPVVATASTATATSEPATTAAQANNVASTSVAITPTFDELTSLSGPATALAGTSQTYTVTATNNGPSPTSNPTTQTVTLPAGITPTNISNGGAYASNVITWTIAAGQAAGSGGAVANSFTIGLPTAGATLTAAVAVTGESNTGNNTASLTTTATNQPPLAQAVVNTLQHPMGNTATASMLISPLLASDPENSLSSTAPYTVVTVPAAAQGVLSYNSSGTAYATVAAGQALTAAQATTLRFLPTSGYAGNAAFTYLATDNAGNQSPAVNYTIPVAPDQSTSYTVYNAGKGNTAANKYATGDVLAQLIDPNTAVYTSAGIVYHATTGVLQAGGANGLPTTGTNAVLASGTLPAGVSLDAATGRIYVSDATKLVNNKMAQDYAMTVTTTDLNGGTNTAPVTFTIGAYPLPVELTAFVAKAVGNRDAALTWTTASEKNNDHFDVERSLDGTTFVKIAAVAGQGTTARATSYALTDAGVAAKAAGPVYYRLVQVDADATATYSPVQAVRFSQLAPLALGLYPNPAGATTQLDLSALPAGTYEVQVVDMAGRTVLRTTLAAGLAHALDLGPLASGSYLVRVSGPAADGTPISLAKRLVKQ